MSKKINVVFFLWFFCLSGFCFSQDDNITAEGSGEGISTEEALLAAKRDAIEKGIGIILLSQTEIENFQVKRDQLITKTIGSVKSYEKLSEGKAADGLFQVKIRAVLSKSSMRQDLAAFHILIESMDKPRVMVVVDENNVGSDEPANQTAESTILQFLKDPYQFDCVDPKMAASVRASQKKMAALTGDDAVAATIGSQSGAEMLICGTAISREAKNLTQNLGGMVSVQADVTLKAINCATGTVVGSAQAHGARVHISANTAGNQAIAQASQKAIEKLLDAIIKDWQNQQNNGITMNLTVTGVHSFRLKNDLLQTFQAVPNVGAVRERSWDGQSKVLMVDIQYKGNTNGFCTRIDGYKLKSGGASLSVSNVKGLKISIILQVM